MEFVLNHTTGNTLMARQSGKMLNARERTDLGFWTNACEMEHEPTIRSSKIDTRSMRENDKLSDVHLPELVAKTKIFRGAQWRHNPHQMCNVVVPGVTLGSLDKQTFHL